MLIFQVHNLILGFYKHLTTCFSAQKTHQYSLQHCIPSLAFLTSSLIGIIIIVIITSHRKLKLSTSWLILSPCSH